MFAVVVAIAPEGQLTLQLLEGIQGLAGISEDKIV
jgi:hypothetical protein